MRRIFLAAALLCSAQALLANNPSSMTGARMVYNEATGRTILFGGVTPFDAGKSDYINPTETWAWNGQRWLQQFPVNTPPGRSSHVMVYDATRARIIVFGGRVGGGNTATDLNDTWAFADNQWTQITTADSPPIRAFSGAAYDRVRDRVVLFGGSNTVPPPSGTAVLPTVTNDYDTLEFDGTDWTKVAVNGPLVVSPILVYDEARNQTVMIGEDTAFNPVMYTYDPSAHTWTQVTPQTMPPCTNEATAAFGRASGTIFLTGGVCVTSKLSSPTTEEAYSWDGTNWTKLVTASTITKTSNAALTYDPRHDLMVVYGGTEAYGSPHSFTYTFDPSLANPTATTPTSGDWVSHDPNFVTPAPRSLAPFISDPVNKVIYLINGNTNGTVETDFWTYQNGGWAKITADSSPACGNAYAAFDTDRAKLVVVCSDGSTSEWDGTAWKAFTDLKTKPKFTRFAAMSYDPTLKRTILYGGWDDTNYLNSTWEWDGTSWTEMKKKAAPARSLTSMWYDPVLKKTVLFGGLGRPTSQDRIQRYQDMWSLDNTNGWTEVKPSVLPNTRYGAQIATDPNTGHTILFGGLRLDSEVKNGTTLSHQVYANDMWEWDGSAWKQLSSTNTPSPRENGAFAWDYAKNNFVLFGGWAGYYLGDVWMLDPATWTWKVIPETTARGRIVNPSHP
ncbi:MAG TPA: kelch repeat-containing protein [Thermoanaerobaculia bacterium]|nr:kelch repeat-containing protein [Thermoanaerobaculia bacterium]